MSWQVSWRTFFFFQGKCSGRGISPAVWQRKCARKLERSSCLVSLVSFSLNNLSGRSWGLCLPSAPSDWILATACQEQNWGAVCLCQQHSLPPEAAWGTVQPWKMETGRYSPTGWVCIGEVASWLQACLPSAPPAKGAGTEDGWWAGPLSFSPAGALVACLAVAHGAPPGHRADGSGVPTAGSILGPKIPRQTLLMGDQNPSSVRGGDESSLQSWPAFSTPWV